MKRILSIDFGLKRIGLAISDENQKIVLPLTTLNIPQPNQAVSLVVKFLQKNNFKIEKIILGNPLLLSGKEGQMSQQVKNFKEKLQKKLPASIPIILWDERLSSSQAEKMLKNDFSRKKRSQKIDPIAAMIILQNYLDSQTC